MNNYILLNGKKYMTPFRDWFEVPSKPARVRNVLDGSVDVTYGPAFIKEWRGTILVPVTPIDGTWGGVSDFDTAIALRQSMSFTDHYGNAHTVHLLGPFKRISNTPKWDGASNEFKVTARIVKA